MAGGESSSSESEDTDYLNPTQTERKTLKELNDQYGSLPRDTFVETIVEKLSLDDLCNIRRSIFDLALETIPDTPRGNLIVRKDTQGHGGLPASDKLADDIFNLVQYHSGDSSVDIVKILSEKSKREYHKHRRQIPASNVTVSDQAVTLDIPIRQFCTELLTEMRKDRDLMSQEIKEMKSDIISTKAIQLEVRGLRTDFNGLLERVTKLESQQSRSPKLSRDIDEKVYQLTTSNTKMSDEILNVRNMFAASTARLNNLELAIRNRPPYIPYCTRLLVHSLHCNQPVPYLCVLRLTLGHLICGITWHQLRITW